MQDQIFFNGAEYIPAGVASITSGLSRDYISRLCKRGEISGCQIGKKWYVKKSSLDQFLKAHNFVRLQRSQALSESRKREYRSVDIAAPVVHDLPINRSHEVSFFAISRSTNPGFYHATAFGNDLTLQATRLPEITLSIKVSVAFVCVLLIMSGYVLLGPGKDRGQKNMYAEAPFAQTQLASVFDAVSNGLSPISDFFAGMWGGSNSSSVTEQPSSDSIVTAYVIPYSPEEPSGASESTSSSSEDLEATTTGSRPVPQPVELVQQESSSGALGTLKNIFDPLIGFFQSLWPFSDSESNTSGLGGVVTAYVIPYSTDSDNIARNDDDDDVLVLPSTPRTPTQPIASSTLSGYDLPKNPGQPNQPVSPTPPAIGILPKPKPSTPIASTSTTTQPSVQQLIVAGVSEAVLNAKLKELETKLSSQIYSVGSLSSANTTYTSNVYQEVAHTNRIDNLGGVDITNSTFDGGSITDSSVAATSLEVTGGATSTFEGGVDIESGCFSINGTCVTGGSSGVTGGTVGMLAAFTSATALTATSGPTAAFFVATSTTIASQFPYASSTALSVTTLCLNGDTCRTTWPSGGGSVWPFIATTSFGVAAQSTSTPLFLTAGLHASSTSQIVSANIWSVLTLKATTSSLLATDAAGNIIATSSVGTNLLTGTLATAQGGTGTSTWQTNSIPFYNGTRFSEANSALSFSGSLFTATNASTTAFSAANQWLPNLVSSLLATDANGKVSATTTINTNLLTANTISGITLGGTLANLTATDGTLTFSGTYTGATARTIGLNLANPNTWTALQTFSNSSSTLGTITTGWATNFYPTYASSTAITVSGNAYLPGSGIWNSSGSVGIGTTSPGSLLSLNNIANFTTATSTFYTTGGINLATGCFAINGSCVSGGGGGGGSGTVNSGLVTNLPFYESTGSAVTATSTLTLTLSGNLGVGTTSPQSRLEVTDSRSVSTTPLRVSNFLSATTTSVGLAFGTGDVVGNTGTTTASIISILQQNFSSSASGGGKGDLVFSVLNSGLLSEAFRINNVGRAGIGTYSNLASQLTVRAGNGNSIASFQKAQSGSAAGGYIEFDGGTDAGEVRGYLGFTKNSGGADTFFTGELADAMALSSFGSLQFGAGGDNIAVTVLGSNRNVGIGTAAPASKLDVNGGVSVGSYAGTNAAPGNSVIISGNLGVGTTSPRWNATFASSTGPQLALVDTTTTSNAWTLRSISNSFYVATSTYFASSTVSALAFNGSTGAATFGAGATTTFTGGIQSTALNITSTSASSTFANGINLAAGCFAVNGTCVGSGGGSGTVSSGTTGQFPYYASAGQTLTATSTIFLSDASRIGIGTTSPGAKLEIEDTSSGSVTTQLHLSNAASATSTASRLSFRALDITGAGTTTAAITSILQQNYVTGKGDLVFSVLANGTLREVGRFMSTSTSAYFGIGTSTPYRQLSVSSNALGNSEPQLALSAGAGAVSQLFTDTSGRLQLTSSGGDTYLLNDNLSICTGGSPGSPSCPTPPSTKGNLLVENRAGIGTSTPQAKLTVSTDNSVDSATDRPFQIASTTNQSIFLVNQNGYVGVGTSTPSEQLSISQKLYVGAGNPSFLGTATSTVQGDLLITGKLDVSTIDPVYTIDGVKYATYGLAGTGVKEETSAVVNLTKRNPATGKYEYDIDFDTLTRGSDLWLFYQVTDLGTEWQNLVVNLTPSFDGSTYYSKLADRHILRIIGTSSGEVSVRLVADRFDGTTWPNVRPDQGTGFPGFELQSKVPL